MHCDYDAQAVVVEPVTAGTSVLALLVQTDPQFTTACNYDAHAVVVEPVTAGTICTCVPQ
jgi:hypothetical protein